MNRKEFKEFMLKTKRQFYRHPRYICNCTGGHRDKFRKLMTKVFNKRDTPSCGIFGQSDLERNQETRKLALEVFETIVLEEKLYKEL